MFDHQWRVQLERLNSFSFLDLLHVSVHIDLLLSCHQFAEFLNRFVWINGQAMNDGSDQTIGSA
jgi:hypothetical protein